MDVVRDGSLVHDRVHTGDTSLGATGHAPEGVGATHEGEGGGGGAPHGDGRRRMMIGAGKFRSRPIDCGVADIDAVSDCPLLGVFGCVSECCCCAVVLGKEWHDPGYQS